MDAHEYEIMECIRRGQQAIRDAVALLMKLYKQQVYEHCFDLLRRDASQAQEITEQTFLKVPSVLVAYKGGKLRVMLLKIATELCTAQRPAIRFEEWIVDEKGQDQPGRLSEQDRVVLYLRSQELKWREVAYILGISERATRQRGSRATRRLAEITHVRKGT